MAEENGCVGLAQTSFSMGRYTLECCSEALHGSTTMITPANDSQVIRLQKGRQRANHRVLCSLSRHRSSSLHDAQHGHHDETRRRRLHVAADNSRPHLSPSVSLSRGQSAYDMQAFNGIVTGMSIMQNIHFGLLCAVAHTEDPVDQKLAGRLQRCRCDGRAGCATSAQGYILFAFKSCIQYGTVN